MSESREATVRVTPFLEGVATRERVIVRRTDAPAYLCLTRPEAAIAAELVERDMALSELLGRHLGGHGGVDFKTAVSLLVRMHQGGFIVGDGNAVDDVAAHLQEAGGSGPRAAAAPGWAAHVVQGASQLFDLSLLTLTVARVHPLVRGFGRLLVSTPGLAAAAAALAGLAVYSGAGAWPDARLWTADLHTPEVLLVKVSVAFSVAASALALLQVAALSGAGARFAGVGLRLTGLCVLRLAVDDTDAFMLPKAGLLRYRLLTMLAPWLAALLVWQLGAAKAFGSSAALLSAAFALIGLVMLCPLYRSPLVKVAEGYLATMNVSARAGAFLASGLFAVFGKRSGAGQRGAGPTHGEHAAQLWLTFLACVSLLWLYGMSLLCADALLSAVPDLWVQLTDWHRPVRATAAGVALTTLGLAMLLPALRLALVPVQNLAAAAAVPLRRVRRGIDSFYDKTLPPSVAVSAFLREIPILADLTDAQLTQLTEALKYRQFGPGQAIITKGDEGREFFILAAGQAQVLLDSGGGAMEVADLLNPGDSFGEIALVEHVLRTATIRARSPCRALVLERGAFDRLFPAGGEARARLTSMIRQVKLVLESQAMSHLAPRQIRELLRHVKSVRVAAGDFLIREDSLADAAYLIESGEVQVVREREATEVCVLGRGELVGAIALLKDVRRTASVRARTDVTCLAIDKATFLKMCMSNIFVALLVSDLSDRQIAHLKAG